jgi:hypothetical protein
MAARFKLRVSGHLLAGFVGSISVGGMHVFPLWVLCVVRWRYLHLADHLYRVVLPIVLCLSVIVKPRKSGGPVPLETIAPWKKL